MGKALAGLDKILEEYKQIISDVFDLKMAITRYEAKGKKLPDEITVKAKILFNTIDNI